ncbi:MAG TPA: FHA domain-containing protein [Polyangia bacterium]|nr:FHA domain-containing protein [Polyangia bacterium]
MPLEVTVKDPTSTSHRTLTFAKSPVRIGRNQLNDIALDDPFVSEWHGLIHFGADTVDYYDLGSTNGTVLDGKRLAKNVPAPLTDRSRIHLGRIEVTVVNRRQVHETGPRKTMAWGRADAADPNASNVAPPPPRGAPSVREQPARVAEVARPPSPSGAFESGIADQNAEFDALIRRQKILEAFSEAFVGLRKGYEQFGAEVGVRTINGRTPLHRARTSREILDHLLGPGVDVATVTHDLIAIFADFGIHHIAMMEAVTEGVRALLQSLDPRANDLDVGGRLFSAAKAKGQWKAYLERFDQALTDDQELHAAIFGAEFARAYARVTQGEGNKRGENDGD